MGVQITLAVDEVWDFFQTNKSRLHNEQVAIAENPDTGYAVFLTEDRGYPLIRAGKWDGKIEEEECAVFEDDCARTVKRLYLKFLFPVVLVDDKYVSSKSEDEEQKKYEEEMEYELTHREMEDIIFEREDELSLATSDFLDVVLEVSAGHSAAEFYGDDFVQEVMDHILVYLSDVHGMEIYRPTLITDPETGSEIYTEYPYGESDDFMELK